MTLIYKRASINDLKKRPNVTLEAGTLKELGADTGGPTREFMHLVMRALVEREVSGCLLFTGEVDHLIPVHNWDLLDDGAFIYNAWKNIGTFNFAWRAGIYRDVSLCCNIHGDT